MNETKVSASRSLSATKKAVPAALILLRMQSKKRLQRPVILPGLPVRTSLPVSQMLNSWQQKHLIWICIILGRFLQRMPFSWPLNVNQSPEVKMNVLIILMALLSAPMPGIIFMEIHMALLTAGTGQVTPLNAQSLQKPVTECSEMVGIVRPAIKITCKVFMLSPEKLRREQRNAWMQKNYPPDSAP